MLPEVVMGILNRLKRIFRGSGRKDVVYFANERGEMEKGVVVERRGKRRPRVVVQRKDGSTVVLPEGKYC